MFVAFKEGSIIKTKCTNLSKYSKYDIVFNDRIYISREVKLNYHKK